MTAVEAGTSTNRGECCCCAQQIGLMLFYSEVSIVYTCDQALRKGGDSSFYERAMSAVLHIVCLSSRDVPYVLVACSRRMVLRSVLPTHLLSVSYRHPCFTYMCLLFHWIKATWLNQLFFF